MTGVMCAQERDEVLAAKARGGDRAAFEELARRHRARVAGMMRKRWPGPMTDQDIDDLLQETFTRALEAIRRFQWESEDSFFRWLSGIAVRVAQEGHKRTRRRKEVALEAVYGRVSTVAAGAGACAVRGGS